jgi:hypothetical protein
MALALYSLSVMCPLLFLQFCVLRFVKRGALFCVLCFIVVPLPTLHSLITLFYLFVCFSFDIAVRSLGISEPPAAVSFRERHLPPQ